METAKRGARKGPTGVFQEYEYGPQHLEDSEALERFAHERARNPHAVVMLDEQDCGRWTVTTHETDAEKERIFRRRLSDIFDSFLAGLVR